MAKAKETTQGLFGESEQIGTTNKYCQIVWNGKVTDRTFLSFLEPQLYDRLTTITYVSSPRFFFKATSGFKHVMLVLGIPEGSIAKQFEWLDPTAHLRFWNDLSEEQRAQILDKSIEVRYARSGNAVHSKIYLLSGPTGRRVLMGSANLTQHAIQGAQYEEVMVSDDPSICDIYEARVEQILQETVDYIPEEAKRHITAIDVENASPELLTRVVQEVASQGKVPLIIPTELIAEVKENVQRVEVEQEQVVLIKNLVKEVFLPSTPGKQVLTAATVTKRYEPIRKLFVHKSKGDALAGMDLLPKLTVGSDMNLYRDGNTSEPYAQNRLTGSEIATVLRHIEHFVEAYRLYTVEDAALLDSERSVGEALLYAFSSPFIWKEREDITMCSKGTREAIPPFLLLAGKACSGKTHLLRFLSILLGADGQYYHYEDVSPSVIRAMLEQRNNQSPNVFPLFIDEVAKEYFAGNGNTGEGNLKFLTDELSGVHPVFIGTTNSTFRGSGQVVRRMYYLETVSTFRPELRAKSEAYFQESVDGLDASLFKDFILRFPEQIRDIAWYDGTDYLAPARAIFNAYYKEAGIPVPVWLSDKILDNYYDRGRRVWRDIYAKSPQAFHVTGGYLKVDPRELWSDSFERFSYVKLLGIDVLKDEQSPILLYRKEFFAFIGIKQRSRFMEWFVRKQ
ncbi:MAG: phospholipase D family protein [Candidatus Cryosericum sp.]